MSENPASFGGWIFVGNLNISNVSILAMPKATTTRSWKS
jgi:hypothetical protein